MPNPTIHPFLQEGMTPETHLDLFMLWEFEDPTGHCKQPTNLWVPKNRLVHPSLLLRELAANVDTSLYAPGIYDAHTAQIVAFHRFLTIYLSGYSFGMAHTGRTDMQFYDPTELANAAQRIISGLYWYQLALANGRPFDKKPTPPRYIDVPPMVADFDGGGTALQLMRVLELYIQARVAGAHIEDQVLPKRCGHIGGKALIGVSDFVAKLLMMDRVRKDQGNPDFVIIARTDAVSAEGEDRMLDGTVLRGVRRAIYRSCKYAETGVPDWHWCEFPSADKGPLEEYTSGVLRQFPNALFAFNCSSSFRHDNDPDPLTLKYLGSLGIKFTFTTLAGIHATGYGMDGLCRDIQRLGLPGYQLLQRNEFERKDPECPSRSHHFQSGADLAQKLGDVLGLDRLGSDHIEHVELNPDNTPKIV